MDALEAGLYFGEEKNVAFHGGALFVLDGPIDLPSLARRVDERVKALPRFRRRAVTASLGLGRPSWVEDGGLNVRAHLSRFPLLPPGGDRELGAAASQFWSLRLDRRKPLWELILLEGLAGGRSAILSKVHRCMDLSRNGPSGAELILDDEVEPRASQVRLPQPAGVWDLIRSLEPTRLVAQLWQLAGTAESLGTLISTPAPETPLNGALGATRRLGWVRLSVPVLRAALEALGGTLDQAVLTVIAAALGELLRARGRNTSDLDLVGLVQPAFDDRPRDARPTSDGDGHALGMLTRIPVGTLPPRARHAAVGAALADPTRRAQLAGLETIFRFGADLPVMIHRALISLAFQAVNTVWEGLPESPNLCRVLGQPVRFVVPLAPLPWNVGIGFSTVAYAERELIIGINADAGRLHELIPVEEALRAAYTELAAAVGVPPLDPEVARSAIGEDSAPAPPL